MNIAILYGSVRTAREGIKAARYVENKLKARGHKATLIDPKETPLPMLDKTYKEYEAGQAPKTMEAIRQTIKEADAYVVVTGEYNHSVPPALSNLLAHFLEEYFWKPSAIVSYSAGGFGGVRAAMQLRALLAEIGTPTIPSTFPISKVQESMSEEGEDKEGGYDKRIGRFLDELEWYAEALKTKRENGTPY